MAEHKFCATHYPLSIADEPHPCAYTAQHRTIILAKTRGRNRNTPMPAKLTVDIYPCSVCARPVHVCCACITILNGPPMHAACADHTKVRALRSDGCLYYREPTAEELEHWNDKAYWRARVIHRDP